MFKHFQLCLDAAVSITSGRWCIGAKTGSRRKTHHRGKLGKVTLHAVVHVTLVARPHIKQLNDITNRGSIEPGELVEHLLGNCHHGMPVTGGSLEVDSNQVRQRTSR